MLFSYFINTRARFIYLGSFEFKANFGINQENMKRKIRRKTGLFIQHAILLFTLICLSLTLFVNDFKTEIVSKMLQPNATLSRELSFEIGLDIRRKLINKWIPTSFSRLGMIRNETRNDSATSGSKFERRLPNAIIIGVKKCGTRALIEYLRLHPNVKATGPEPHFFDRYYHLGLEWYRRKMPKSSEGQLTIEKTPRYFVTEEVPQRIYNLSKTIKLILVVRNPVTRAISDFTQAVNKGQYNETVTFRSRAIRRNGTVNKRWSAINIGLYAYHLKTWLRYFPMENIHVVDGELLIQNPIYEVNRVQDFLGLDRNIPEEAIYMNVTKGFPCITRRHKPPFFKCFRNSKGRPHSYTDKGTLSLLREFYKPYNEQFFKITKKQFHW